MLYLIGGSKGGVGKSFVARGLIHFLDQLGTILVIDTDPSNPDIYKVVTAEGKPKPGIIADVVIWEARDAFSFFTDNLERKKYGEPANIVINTGGGALTALIEYSDYWDKECLSQIGHLLKTIWPIDTSFDSLEALSRYVTCYPDRVIDVIKNGKDGQDIYFEFWHQDALPLREKIVQAGGNDNLYMTRMGTRAANALRGNGLMLSEFDQIRDRKCQKDVQFWLKENETLFRQIIGEGEGEERPTTKAKKAKAETA
jgi:hypothetical protein